MNDRPWEVWWRGLRTERLEKRCKYKWSAHLWRWWAFAARGRIYSYVKRAEVAADPWEQWCAHAEQTGHLLGHNVGDRLACLAPRCGFTTGA